MVAEVAWKTVEAVKVSSIVALLVAVTLTSVYEKVVVASVDGRTDVLIACSATFAGSATFAVRGLNFDIGNRGLSSLGSFHFVNLMSNLLTMVNSILFQRASRHLLR